MLLCVRTAGRLVIEGEGGNLAWNLVGVNSRVSSSHRMLGLAAAHLRAHAINATRPLLFSARALPQRAVMPQVHMAMVESSLDLPFAGAVAPIVAMNRNARIPRKVCPAQWPPTQCPWEMAPPSVAAEPREAPLQPRAKKAQDTRPRRREPRHAVAAAQGL